MKQKLDEIFDKLNNENQTQLLDYAKMLLEIQSGEEQVAEKFKVKGANNNKDLIINRLNKDIIK